MWYPYEALGHMPPPLELVQVHQSGNFYLRITPVGSGTWARSPHAPTTTLYKFTYLLTYYHEQSNIFLLVNTTRFSVPATDSRSLKLA